MFYEEGDLFDNERVDGEVHFERFAGALDIGEDTFEVGDGGPIGGDVGVSWADISAFGFVDMLVEATDGGGLVGGFEFLVLFFPEVLNFLEEGEGSGAGDFESVTEFFDGDFGVDAVGEEGGGGLLTLEGEFTFGGGRGGIAHGSRVARVDGRRMGETTGKGRSSSGGAELGGVRERTFRWGNVSVSFRMGDERAIGGGKRLRFDWDGRGE